MTDVRNEIRFQSGDSQSQSSEAQWRSQGSANSATRTSTDASDLTAAKAGQNRKGGTDSSYKTN